MNLLSGKQLSEEVKQELKLRIKNYMIKPCLAVIQVGDDPASNIYVANKEKACNEVGIYFKLIKYDVNVLEKEITNKILELNNDDYVHGIIVQLPIPENLNTQRIINHISSIKDVDGLNDINSGRLLNNKEGMVPCTAQGIIDLLKYNNIQLNGANVTIVGRGKLVGKPLSILLLREDATVTICHSKTKNLKDFTSSADIVISATGCKHLLTEDYFKEGAVIVDAGITKEDKIYGDVDFDNVKDKASYITPCVGGVGPMTVISLLKNVLKSYDKVKK